MMKQLTKSRELFSPKNFIIDVWWNLKNNEEIAHLKHQAKQTKTALPIEKIKLNHKIWRALDNNNDNIKAAIEILES